MKQHPLSRALVNSTTNQLDIAVATTYLDILNHVFHIPTMEFLMHASEVYLAGGLEASGRMYQNGVSTYLDGLSITRVLTLIAFILACVLLFFFVYNPMCWQLDAEQKRTSAMLLLIPNEVFERIPSIRDFVQKL
jgi:hypothetical protein